MNLFQLTFTIEKEMVLREFLASRDISKRTLTAIKYQGGKLLVNGIERDVRYSLQTGDVVSVVFPPEELSDGLLAEDGQLNIIYEDDALLIIQKPSGQSTIPSSHHRTGTVANYVAGKFQEEKIPATVHVITRLDYDTSGLVCIAKNRHIHHLLSKQLHEGSFTRVYEAIVEGYVEENQLTIEAPIGRKPNSIIERMVCEEGQKAKTHMRVIERFTLKGQPFTCVALVLETGRTHQIRVHMSWLGHPLVGDDLYGGKKGLMNRQALHCKHLSFNHPITEEEKTFTCSLPPDMQHILNQKV